MVLLLVEEGSQEGRGGLRQGCSFAAGDEAEDAERLTSVAVGGCWSPDGVARRGATPYRCRGQVGALSLSLFAELRTERADQTTEQHEGRSSSTRERTCCLRCTVLVYPGCIQISRSPFSALTLSFSSTPRPAPSSK